MLEATEPGEMHFSFDHVSSELTWLSIIGAVFSGLGATLNGLNSLYGVTSHISPSAASVASGVVGGTMALTSGWAAAAKAAAVSSGGAFASGSAGGGAMVGAAAGALSISTLGVGAGCVYASLGLLYFAHSLARLSCERPPKHAPAEGSLEAQQYPSPDWLSTRVLNWGVMGKVGVGKSSLVNAIRGLQPRSPEAAPVGIGHTTRRPRPYSFNGQMATLTRNMARIWDLPGAGTKDWPLSTYICDAGLRHFDGIVFVTCGAFTENEAELLNQLVVFKVPYYIVRNKVDQDAVNNAEDYDVGVEETMTEIRSELSENGCDPKRTFLISAKHPERAEFEFGALLATMAADVVAQRSALPEFCEELLPLGISSLWGGFRASADDQEYAEKALAALQDPNVWEHLKGSMEHRPRSESTSCCSSPDKSSNSCNSSPEKRSDCDGSWRSCCSNSYDIEKVGEEALPQTASAACVQLIAGMDL